MSRPIDTDIRQSIKDLFFTRNRYRLDTRYVLQDGKKHPFAVLCPGGGYQMVCSFIEGTPIARKLNEKGISAFILYYRVKRRAQYPAPMQDLARAVTEILGHAEQYQIDTNSYSIWGGSAGGHLAASFGTDNMGYRTYNLPKPGALILSYPVISMQDPHLPHNWLLGENASKDLEDTTSIQLHVTPEYPPTYIWCGADDNIVPPEHTKMLVAALNANKVPVECDVFPGVGHGIGPGTGTAAEGWIDKAVNFWRLQR